MESKELTIVVVTFKSDEVIHSCLRSIPRDIKVIVVENSNSNEFKQKIEKKYPNVNCILTGENKGYSIGNNIGLEKVTSDFALILNPDTTLESDTIKNFFDLTKQMPNFTLIGPSNNQSINEDFSSDYLQVKDLKGFAIFLNLKRFEKKIFDENFFLYFEEIDLCKRVIEEGGKIFLGKNLKINHESAKSVETNKNIELEKNRNWHWMWSSFYFYKKHRGFFFALIIIFPKLLSSFFKSIIFTLIFNKEKRDIYFCRLSGILNSIIGKKSWFRPSLD